MACNELVRIAGYGLAYINADGGACHAANSVRLTALSVVIPLSGSGELVPSVKNGCD